MRLYILPYINGSKSVKILKEELEALEIRREGSRYRPRKGDVMINWGCSSSPIARLPEIVVNSFEDVSLFSCKLQSFDWFLNNNIATPAWTQDKEVAKQWPVTVCRTLLKGHSGQGIVIVNEGDTLPDAPLYVQYAKKKDEYRVHFMAGNVIDIQKKMRKWGVEHDHKVRNIHTGWIYGREDVVVPESVVELAEDVVSKCPLAFGAIDIIYNEKYNTPLVLEINTAPGLYGTTLGKYVEAFDGTYSSVRNS
jgi:glutathione synthase/RimK-type ligase-like ATP-grasp enzyme